MNSKPRRIKNASDNTSTGALAATAGAVLASGAGGTTITTCPPDDKSFYCNFVKGFNIFKMILFILVVVIIAYFIYRMIKKK